MTKAAMISLSKAFAIVDREIAGISLSSELLPVRKAPGRTIAENQVSRLDLPPFDKSAVDGYAVPAGDDGPEYDVLETVPAGCVPTEILAAGTAAKVMTGAPVPKGTGKVVMVEQTRRIEGKVRILSPSKAANICGKGEDVRRGQVILSVGTRLGPLEIAVLISAGITEVKVFRPVRVSIISTGDEIVDSPDRLAPGKIMNSNGPLLSALCNRCGLEVVDNSTVADEFAATLSAIRTALAKSDLVLLSGGVSVGDFDFVPGAMAEAGLKMHFSKVAVKPGRPMTFASSCGKAAFGLPGNPVAVYLMFCLFVLRAARRITGQKNHVRLVTLPLGRDYRRRSAERIAYLPCRLTRNGTIEPTEYHGTAHLQALLGCDGLFVVPSGVTELPAGRKVDFISIRGGFE